jgi:hypothetical protein
MPASPSLFQTGRPQRTNWLPVIADWLLKGQTE